MAHFNPQLDTALIVDAGKIGLGAILVQTQDDNTIRPVAFASRTLTSQECRYSQTEREALSVVWGCERFHLYLYGKPFDILTDHQPLEVLYTHTGKPSPRILRWGLRLQSYEYNIKYIPGKLNPADMLSINPMPLTAGDKKESEVTERYINNLICYSTPKAISLSEILKESAEDEEMKKIIQCVKNNESGVYIFQDSLPQRGGQIYSDWKNNALKKLNKKKTTHKKMKQDIKNTKKM